VEVTPVVPEVVPVEDEAVGQDASGPKTEDSAHTDTPSQPALRRRSKPTVSMLSASRSSILRRTKPRWLLFFLLVILFAAALGFSLIWFLQNAGPAHSGRAVRRVSVNAANAGAFPSIQHALRESKPGDKIVLLDPVHVESLVVDGVFGPTAVTIEAAEGINVRWVSPASHGSDEPIIRLTGSPGFLLKGNGIQIDGQNRHKALIFISGFCPGLTVENLELKNFVRNAVTMASCIGETKFPVRLRNLRTSSSNESVSAGIIFEFDASNKSKRKSNFVSIEHCRFEGLPTHVTEPVLQQPEFIAENVRVVR
jgi:hypothetical protein